MSSFEATRGFWIGLGIAMVIFAFIYSLSIVSEKSQVPEIECIKRGGEWKSDHGYDYGKYCHQKRDES